MWYHHRLEKTLHLVILREPYLSRILSGQKRIESRFARDRRPPFARVNAGDILLLKRAGGSLVGLALVKHVISRALMPDVLDEIRHNYAADLAIDDPHFWQMQLHKRYVTLIWIDEVYPLSPIPLSHRDRRGRVVIERYNGCSFVAGDVQRFQFLRCVGEAMKTLAKLYLVPTMD